MMKDFQWEQSLYEPPNPQYHCDQWAIHCRSALIVIEGPSVAKGGYQIRGGRKVFADLSTAKAHGLKTLRREIQSAIKEAKQNARDAEADLSTLDRIRARGGE